MDETTGSGKSMWVWIIIAIVVIGAGWWLMSNKAPADTGPIKIGLVLPLTGDASSIGMVNKAAVQVAVDEVNAAGGVNDRKIEMVYEDGKCNASAAVSAFQKLTSVDKVGIVIGGLCSTETAAIGPMSMQSKVILFSPGSSAPTLSKLGKYFFRDYPSDAYAGKFGADYAYQKMGVRKVAILYHISDYGTGIKDEFTKEFEKLGGTVVDVEGTPQEATDYRTQLSKIKSLNPDLIYSPMYPAGATVAINQAVQLGIKTKFLAADTFGDPALQKAISGKGTFIFSQPTSASIPPDVQQKIFAITGGTEIPLATGNAYDIIKILAVSIASVGTDPDKLSSAIRAIDYNGVSGRITFDQNGDLSTASYEVRQIENGSSTLIPQ